MAKLKKLGKLAIKKFISQKKTILPASPDLPGFRPEKGQPIILADRTEEVNEFRKRTGWKPLTRKERREKMCLRAYSAEVSLRKIVEGPISVGKPTEAADFFEEYRNEKWDNFYYFLY